MKQPKKLQKKVFKIYKKFFKIALILLTKFKNQTPQLPRLFNHNNNNKILSSRYFSKQTILKKQLFKEKLY